MSSRGILNHNPGNLRKSSTKWRGQAPEAQQTDPAFIVFLAPVWGLRALMKVLLTYQKKYGLKTVGEIIHRWAPPSDNNPTDKYAEFCARAMGVKTTQAIILSRPSTLIALARAIVRFENGVAIKPAPVHWYSDDLYAKAAALALL